MAIQFKVTANKIPYRVVFVPDPVCWTEAPEDREYYATSVNAGRRDFMTVLKAINDCFSILVPG